MSRTALILPVRNAGRHLDRLLPALAAQSLRPDEWLVLDSESSDDSKARLLAAGASVVSVRAADFNHGGTRRLASELCRAEVLIYLTQDAIPADPDALRRLRDAVLAEDDIGVAYGRQLPQPDAGLLGAHARRFNYPPLSRTKRLADAAELGIKTCFSSDSFAAYRHAALKAVGGFPADVIGTEDAHVAGRLLLAGWAVRYEADARVHHSHDYGLLEEMRRYFDIGVFYGRERWIAEHFGRAGGEGRRFLRSELAAVRGAGQPWRAGSAAAARCKLTGYRLGHAERWSPPALKRRLSLFPGYWK